MPEKRLWKAVFRNMHMCFLRTVKVQRLFSKDSLHQQFFDEVQRVPEEFWMKIQIKKVSIFLLEAINLYSEKWWLSHLQVELVF